MMIDDSICKNCLKKNNCDVLPYSDNCNELRAIAEHDKEVYNKAIDDFYNALADDLTWLMRFGDEVYIDVGNDVRIRAEQLKAGEQNDR